MGKPAYATWQNNTNPSWWKDPGLRKMMWSMSVVHAGSFTFGYDGTLLASLIILPQWREYFNNPVGQELGLIAASFYFPKIVAPFPAAWASDRFGRRLSLCVGAAIALAGSLVTTFSTSRGMLIGGRVILGFGAGFKQCIAPYLLQELAHPRLRSSCGAMYFSSYFIGTICAGWFGFAVLNWDSEWAWRLLCLIQGVGALYIIVYICCGLMTESPRWLLNVGREADCHRVLAKLHANGLMDDELVLNELAEMKEVQRTAEAANNVSLKAFIATPGNRRRAAAVAVAAAGTQLTGSVLISAYLGPILTDLGITDPAQQVGLLSGLNMFGFAVVLVVATQVIERYGRRPVWLVSITGHTICFAIFTGLSGGYANSEVPAMGVATLPFIYLFFGFYVACWSTLAPTYATEILPTMLRSKGIGLYMFVQSITVTYNQYVNPIALAAIAWRYYFLFLALQVCFLLYAYFFFLETKGYTMEEVARVFDGKDAVEAVQRGALESELDKAHAKLGGAMEGEAMGVASGERGEAAAVAASRDAGVHSGQEKPGEVRLERA